MVFLNEEGGEVEVHVQYEYFKSQFCNVDINNFKGAHSRVYIMRTTSNATSAHVYGLKCTNDYTLHAQVWLKEAAVVAITWFH